MKIKEWSVLKLKIILKIKMQMLKLLVNLDLIEEN